MMIKTRKAVFKHQVKRLTMSQSFLLARKWKLLSLCGLSGNMLLVLPSCDLFSTVVPPYPLEGKNA